MAHATKAAPCPWIHRATPSLCRYSIYYSTHIYDSHKTLHARCASRNRNCLMTLRTRRRLARDTICIYSGKCAGRQGANCDRWDDFLYIGSYVVYFFLWISTNSSSWMTHVCNIYLYGMSRKVAKKPHIYNNVTRRVRPAAHRKLNCSDAGQEYIYIRNRDRAVFACRVCYTGVAQ